MDEFYVMWSISQQSCFKWSLVMGAWRNSVAEDVIQAGCALATRPGWEQIG